MAISLWDELKKIFEQESPVSAEAFSERLLTLLKELTGCVPEREQQVYAKQYDKGGMSRGLVSGRFWMHKGFPLLIKRFNEVVR